MLPKIISSAQKLWHEFDLAKFSPRGGTFLIAIIAVITFGRDYWLPQLFFWDENYHVASAQKYLEGVFFLEPHPPFGKLMIAAGEALLSPNSITNQFISTDFAPATDGISMIGYRFFPVLFTIFGAMLFFRLLHALLGSIERALLLSLCFVLDTALIVHSRAAMLESVQICFLLATGYSAFQLLNSENTSLSKRWAFNLGASFGLAVTTKVTSFFLLSIAPILFFTIHRRRKYPCLTFGIASLSSILVICIVMYLHFALLRNINPNLPEEGGYGISASSMHLIQNSGGSNIANLPILMTDYLGYIRAYNEKVPLLNLCKEDENGSPPYFWPFGARSIKYLSHPHEDKVAYLYLQANPVVWLISLIGVFGVAALLIAKIFFWNNLVFKHTRTIAILFFLYLSYMIPMLLIGRVMYLYHYFIPLLIGVILFGLLLEALSTIGRIQLSEKRKDSVFYCIALAIICGFIYFSPLAYFRPLKNDEISARAWLPIWDLRCADCVRTSKLALPITSSSNSTQSESSQEMQN